MEKKIGKEIWKKIKDCNRQAGITYGIILLATGLFVYLMSATNAPDMCVDNEDIVYLKEGWEIRYQEKVEHKELPISIPAKKGDTLIYSTVLKDPGFMCNTIMLPVRDQYLRLYLDEELFFEYGYENKTPIGNAPFRAWVIARLPNDWEGKTLSIEQTAYYNRFAGIFDKVYLGTKNALVFLIIRESMPKIFMNLAVALVSVILFCVSFFFKRKDMTSQLRCLSLFSFFTSIWLILESGGNQLFLSSMPLAYGVICLLLSLLPILCVKFILTYSSFSESRYMNVMFWLSVGNFLVTQLLLFTNLIRYWNSTLGTQILSLLIIVGILIQFIDKKRDGPKLRDKNLYASCLLFAGFICVDIIRLYFGNPAANPVVFSQYGLLLFIFTLSVFAVRRIAMDNEKVIKQELLQHMAYTDMLTNIPNRNAFEREMEYYRKNNTLHPIIMVADLNYLKTINDTFGHKAGDCAISTVAQALREHFKDAKIFRIGGDEFCVLTDTMEEAEFAVHIRDFRNEIERVGKQKQLPLMIACGWLREIGEGIDQAFIQADTKMYQNKERIKQICGYPKEFGWKG